MKTYFITLLVCATLCLNLSCDDFEYQYADKEDISYCNDSKVNEKLLKEALYEFENTLLNVYDREKKTVMRGYTNYINAGLSGTVPDASSVPEHTRQIFEALKKDKNLWQESNGKYHLNYNSDLMNCIVENISDKDLQTTFKSLLSTNSMRSRLIGTAIQSKIGLTKTDKYLSTFIALDMYYARLFETKFTDSK